MYWQPGYILAQEAQDDTLIATYQESLRECGAMAPLPEETPDPNAVEQEGDGTDTTEGGEDSVETNT